MNNLVKQLNNKELTIGERDDAAMDLYEYDNDEALQALVQVAQDETENSMILNSCGESIGSIWVTRNSFDKNCYDSLREDAQYGIYYVLREEHPEWLEPLGIRWKERGQGKRR